MIRESHNNLVNSLNIIFQRTNGEDARENGNEWKVLNQPFHDEPLVLQRNSEEDNVKKWTQNNQKMHE